MSQLCAKQAVALAALPYVCNHRFIGVGSGTTVHHFIDALATVKHSFEAAVASSQDTEQRLKAHGISVIELNHAGNLDLYIDGADEYNTHKELIKGGGGALTREKIIAQCAKKFICLVDHSKAVRVLGAFPVAVEVIPMARSFVAREILKLGGQPDYRTGFTTDNGHVILDIHQLDLTDPKKMEIALNQIPGVVCHGIFACRRADTLLIGRNKTVTTL